MTKDQLLGRVKNLVAEVTRARFEGGAHTRLMRAHGYADGYMRALMDVGLVTRAELLALVGETRGEVVQAELEPAGSVAARKVA